MDRWGQKQNIRIQKVQMQLVREVRRNRWCFQLSCNIEIIEGVAYMKLFENFKVWSCWKLIFHLMYFEWFSNAFDLVQIIGWNEFFNINRLILDATNINLSIFYSSFHFPWYPYRWMIPLLTIAFAHAIHLF